MTLKRSATLRIYSDICRNISEMIAYPKAKINVGLHILSKRSDGFHELETAFVAVDLCDILECIEAPDGQLRFSHSGIAIDGNSDQNLVLKAYRLIAENYTIPPLHIHLRKQIPIGAGLGGGSSDAASMLLLLNENYQLGIARQKLWNYAHQLGSDVAFFLDNKPALGTGRGDELCPIDLSQLDQKWIVIVKPDVHISTAEAYSGVKPFVRVKSLKNLLENDLKLWESEVVNDFETSIYTQYPYLSILKDRLYSAGAIYASMSGSGSAHFALFATEPDTRSLPENSWIGKLSV